MGGDSNSEIPNPDEWVDLFGDLLFGMAMYRTDKAELAEELVQETFLRAIKGLKGFQGKGSFKSWLRSILSNVINDHYRKTYRTPNFVKSDAEEGMDPEDFSAIGPDQFLEKKEIWEALEFCLTQIPKKAASVFRQKEMEGMSTRDIAEKEKTTEGNVLVILHRARKALKDCLVGMFSRKGEKE